ncbi:MAG: TolB family protein, partial [Ardenticatenaceae bacterium]
MRALPLVLCLGFLALLSGGLAHSGGEGWFVVSRRTAGQTDLWAAPAGGGPWQRLTETPEDERWPAWHPEGHTLAYAARRERNWDIYALDLRTGAETRLTTNPHFDGWPTWSPDGTRLAFASTGAGDGDLDLFLLEPDTGELSNLTPESPAHAFDPAWEDENHLLFVSTPARSHDIFRLDLDDLSVEPLTESRPLDERHPIPLADGSFLAIWTGNRSRALHLMRASGTPSGEPFSWSDSVFSAALSPDGDAVAWLERRIAGDTLYRRAVDGGAIRIVNGPTPRLDDLAWGAPDDSLMRQRLHEPEAPALPKPPDVVSSEFARLADLDTPLPQMSARVLEPFGRWRSRLADELGDDFLGTVSEALRPIDFSTAGSDYLSWHKAGRAVDTLLSLGFYDGHQWLEITQERWHGDLYWRIWLRCVVQDGSCGEPLIEAPWDYSQKARWELAPGEGGVRALYQPDYYVDLTRIAEEEGWERISSYEYPDFDWRVDQ